MVQFLVYIKGGDVFLLLPQMESADVCKIKSSRVFFNKYSYMQYVIIYSRA